MADSFEIDTAVVKKERKKERKEDIFLIKFIV